MFAIPSSRPVQVSRLATEDLRTWANLVTLIRTAAGLALFAIAAIEHSVAWNLIGLAVYWSLDILDGFLARPPAPADAGRHSEHKSAQRPAPIVLTSEHPLTRPQRR
jgi:hypothetical protein